MSDAIGRRRTAASSRAVGAVARVIGGAGMVLAAAAFVTACGGGQAGRPDVATVDTAKPVAATPDPAVHGKYLVESMGCIDCHTPLKMGPHGPEPDTAAMLAGHPAALKMPPSPNLPAPWGWVGSLTNTAYAGPWGVSYAINLTPDEETGIGQWSEQVFVNALKTGKHLGVGREILPPMPWRWYSRMTDDDLKAIYVYLRTIPARKNQVPDAVVAEPPAAPPTAPAGSATPRG